MINLLPVIILALTETWLEESNTHLIKIPGYRFIHRYRSNTRDGEVGLLIREGISFQVIDTLGSDLSPFPSFEGLFIQLIHKIGTRIKLDELLKILKEF